MNNVTRNINTEKSKPTLVVDGFLFIRDKEYKGKCYWLCNNYYSPEKCKTRIHTNTENGEIIKIIGEHTHAGNATNVGVKRSITDLKDKAHSTHDSTQLIIANCSTEITNAVKAHMPSIPSMKRTVRKIRQGAVTVPQTVLDLCVLDQYKVTSEGKPFLLYDSGAIENRILVFSTEDNLKALSKSNNWYVDGTFKTVPLIFNQLFMIHGIQENLSIPLVYALLPNKSTETYKNLFEQLKILSPDLHPTNVMSDFEQAIVNAVKSSFVGCRQHFCLFHLGQNVYWKLGAAGFKNNYNQDAEFAHKMKMLLALAFVPPEDVIQAFDSFLEQNLFSDTVNEVLDYFEDNYIGRLDSRSKNITGRRDPRYTIKEWNVYEAVQQGFPRTNNNVEGWHNGFMKLVGSEHPSIWCFFWKNCNWSSQKMKYPYNKFLLACQCLRRKKNIVITTKE